MGGESTDHHHNRISATKSDGVDQGKLYSPDHAIKIATKSDKSVGQGKLYSPDHAINIATTNHNSVESSNTEEERGKQRKMMILGLKNLAAVKDKVLEKLAAAAVPSESLENAKQFLEGVIRDFAGAAQGLTKEALNRIKTHLAVILPSISPAVTEKVGILNFLVTGKNRFTIYFLSGLCYDSEQIVDDAEKEVIKGEKENESKSKENSGEQFAGKLPNVSPSSSFLGTLAKPFSKL